ncbi:LuxR C-terminal-related transcriptional regulator [Adhaeribacter soli]|uniref:PAS domain-containing protein n=1 Tax=Adhaeribacter soli TaxID=2607655 RepID=A0A5N1J468_9BACT|nr:LuxR C-terminal-related transcriptional regulator [Adhaeribacter soli]KAA9345701.1 PAS domain-containing protein [Adhaeribacter soli]
MQNATPSTPPTEDGNSLEARIQAKIAEIEAIANELPGVIIIHNNLDLSVVYMSERGTEILGFTVEELKNLGVEYHDRFFNPEESKHFVPKIMELLQRNDRQEWICYFQQVRPSEDHKWTWYASSTKILMHDDDGRPVLNITIALPLDTSHHLTTKVERLQKENDFLRNNYSKFATLSNRERDVLKLTALGKSSNEIADILFISTATVDTHRKHFKKKLSVSSSYEISQYAMAFDLI